jgi:hypothetical protein
MAEKLVVYFVDSKGRRITDIYFIGDSGKLIYSRNRNVTFETEEHLLSDYENRGYLNVRYEKTNFAKINKPKIITIPLEYKNKANEYKEKLVTCRVESILHKLPENKWLVATYKALDVQKAKTKYRRLELSKEFCKSLFDKYGLDVMSEEDYYQTYRDLHILDGPKSKLYYQDYQERRLNG